MLEHVDMGIDRFGKNPHGHIILFRSTSCLSYLFHVIRRRALAFDTLSGLKKNARETCCAICDSATADLIVNFEASCLSVLGMRFNLTISEI